MEVLVSGFEAILDYVLRHVLTYLVPAFLLAGGLVSFVDREKLVGLMGRGSFVLASFFSVFLAACSCTLIPLAANLYYSGVGTGTAFVVLWMAPAVNVLALTYTPNYLVKGGPYWKKVSLCCSAVFFSLASSATS